MIDLFRYQSGDGREPFTEWLNALRDRVAQARIRVRLRQVQAGNFGDVQPVGAGVSELRIHVGAGYRVILRPARENRRHPALRRRPVQPDRRYPTRPGALVGMETEAIMTHLKGAISHHEREIAELRADRDLAFEYLKASI